MGKFRLVTELSARDTSRILFPDDNMSKYQWVFTKLAMCIDIVEICFGAANGQILSIFDRVMCPRYDSGRVFTFYCINRRQTVFRKWDIGIHIACIQSDDSNGKTSSVFRKKK